VLWQSVYVGVGSNLDDPTLQVRRALQNLAQLPATRLVRQSALYGSRPWGFAQQPDFVNAVAALLTQVPVREFSRPCKLCRRDWGVCLRPCAMGRDASILIFCSTARYVCRHRSSRCRTPE
jgi:hypothetical protein